MKTITLITALTTSLLAALAIAAPADSASAASDELPWYQVELIVFEPLDPVDTNEKWPIVVEQPSPADMVELSQPASRTAPAKPVAFQLLPASEFALQSVSKQLSAGNRNHILLHIAWRQPLVENGKALAVHIHSGLNEPAKDTTEKPAVAENAKPVVLNQLPDQDNTNLAEPAAPVETLDGTVKLILSRYLHLKTHLLYHNPEIDLARQIAAQETDRPAAEYFLLKESRRVKRKEIHYLDHPYFGVIARVTRYEQDKSSNR